MNKPRMDKLTRSPIRNRRSTSDTPEKGEASTPKKRSTPHSKTPSPAKPDQSDELSDSETLDSNSTEEVTSFMPNESVGDSKKTENENWFKNNSYFLILIVLVVCGCLALMLRSHNNESKTEEKVPTLGDVIISKLEENFKKQQKFSLRSIKKSINSVTDSEWEPERPSTLLLISSEDAEKTANCLALYLAKLTSELTSGGTTFVNIDGEQYHNQNSDQVKETIDDKIEESVVLDKFNIVLVKNIDYLPGKSPLIFYKYCDDQNAPYKKSIIIMTISGKKPIPDDVEYKQLNKIAHSRLNETWTDLSVDIFEPLYNRIAGYLGGIHKEPNLKHCNL